MKLPIINKQDEKHSNLLLKDYYQNNLIPAEKKNYLTDLRSSQGPFLAIEGDRNETKFLMDAASQIATLGLGFSPSVFFGGAHYLESWLNDKSGSEFINIRKALESFLKRKLDWEELDLTLCNSGAEANEIALGYCYRTRYNKKANKVLAFEGSFHGRMMITLASTWNKVKREPFEWPENETTYCSFPEIDGDKINVVAPLGWKNLWANASANEITIPAEWKKDKELVKEIDSLLEVRKELEKNELFAILVEPMQCEGGDRYATGRFNEALILLAHSFNVQVVYDEVQTGFHLGKEFFWHREFNMTDEKNLPLYPDYVVCAKKAQVGMVLSHKNIWGLNKYEEFQVASTVRGYLHGVALDQAQSQIIELEERTRVKLNEFCERFSEHVSRPRVNGMAFAFQVPSAEVTTQFITKRFDHGLLYYPAGATTLRFRLNTSYSDKDINFLFERLTVIADNIFNKVEETFPTHFETKKRINDVTYSWHELIIETKFKILNNEEISKDTLFKQVNSLFSKTCKDELFIIDQNNFKEWQEQIEQMQKTIYEPTRQTEIEKFEESALNTNSVAIGVREGNKLVAMAFSSPLYLNPLERGVRNDPHFENEKAMYMIDSTVSSSLQGKGLGKTIKYALTALSMVQGVERIHGRNRDRLAASMLNINLSLGAYELMYMKEDYPDFESYRDVFYYSTTTNFKELPLNLSNAIETPLTQIDITKDYVAEQMPYIVNKVCLSNFVSKRFLDQVKNLTNLLPENLRHAYTTSGQSECVDKISKSIWYTSTEKRNHMITFKGHFFGNGSFLSRSLSYEKDAFFNVSHFDKLTEENSSQVLSQIEDVLEKRKTMAIWIEPLTQNSMQRVSREDLIKLKALAHKYDTKIIFNETASATYRYNNENFFASYDEEISPDAGMCFLGGQAGLCFKTSDHFIEKPLMLISTWDGDEFSFSNFNYASNLINNNLEDFRGTQIEFTNKLTAILEKYPIEELELENGCGYFIGNISKELQEFFELKDNRYIVNPSFSSMKRFIRSTH
ncbi:hypothetical protein A9Q84_17265 [Halobacteriovorax marinus]|uniref:N-acetyltransferase domain-containing protein n=1 Tax=Halobacteriovorax marinus TaxID=97084 RepID=A0A1Y5F7L3_9BACT|nr:hypothetical protein A9Q84_17265 [Halobacteriovorax marinus]